MSNNAVNTFVRKLGQESFGEVRILKLTSAVYLESGDFDFDNSIWSTSYSYMFRVYRDRIQKQGLDFGTEVHAQLYGFFEDWIDVSARSGYDSDYIKVDEDWYEVVGTTRQDILGVKRVYVALNTQRLPHDVIGVSPFD